MLATATKSDVKAVEPPKIKNAATVGWFQQCVHRGKNEIFSEVKTITPAMAEVILTNNPDNRNIRAAKFEQLVSDMKNGRFTLNGEPIIISKTGELNDGQHRLLALLQAKVSLPLLFVFGVERETRTTLDQGAGRSAGDYLSMGGVPYATQIAAIARLLISYEKSGRTMLGKTSRVTSAEILERAEKDKTIATSAAYANKQSRHMKYYATSGILGFCHNVFLHEHATEGLAFMEMLCSGENLHRKDPAFKAREKLMSLGRESTATKVEIIFRAWNAYREKRQMTTIPVHGRLPELV